MKKLTLEDIKTAVAESIKNGYTSVAPLGKSGDSIMLYKSRTSKSTISISLHSDTVELLMKDENGRFIAYNCYTVALGINKIAKEHYNTLQKFKCYIDKDVNFKNKVVDKLR